LDAYQRAAELDANNKHIQQRLTTLRSIQSKSETPTTTGEPKSPAEVIGEKTLMTMEPRAAHVGGEPPRAMSAQTIPTVPDLVNEYSVDSLKRTLPLMNSPLGDASKKANPPPNLTKTHPDKFKEKSLPFPERDDSHHPSELEHEDYENKNHKPHLFNKLPMLSSNTITHPINTQITLNHPNLTQSNTSKEIHPLSQLNLSKDRPHKQKDQKDRKDNKEQKSKEKTRESKQKETNPIDERPREEVEQKKKQWKLHLLLFKMIELNPEQQKNFKTLQ